MKSLYLLESGVAREEDSVTAGGGPRGEADT